MTPMSKSDKNSGQIRGHFYGQICLRILDVATKAH